jgi:cytochrome P450
MLKAASWLSGSAFALGSNTLEFYADCERRGGLVKTHVWRLPVYVVTDPRLIEDVLVRKHRSFMKSAGLRATQRGFGHGLLTSDGKLWRQQRRIMQPAFQAHRIERYQTAMEQATERLMASFGNGGERNIHRDMTDLCFEALTLSLFGQNMMQVRDLVAEAADALHGFHENYSQWIGSLGGLVFTLLRTVSTALGRPDFVIDPTILPTSYSRRFRNAVAALDRVVVTLIRERRRQPSTDDLLGLLVSASDETGQPLTERQIRDEVVTMFFAGHETGAAALSWAFYLLASHPECSDKAIRECEAGDGGAFIDQIMREAMRLYPPAYRISRTVIETCKLGDVEIKAGAELVIPQWAIHRSSRYYVDPEVFRPERWSSDLMATLPHFAYLPFGGGPRTCIGNTFGMAENRFVVSQILRHFKFEAPVHEPGFDLGVTLLPKNNTLNLNLTRRTRFHSHSTSR